MPGRPYSLCGCIIVSECVSSDHKWAISSEKILTAAIYFGLWARVACVRAYFASLCARSFFKMPEHFRHSANEYLSCLCAHIRVWFLFFCETGAHQITPLFLIILLLRLSLPYFYMQNKRSARPIELIDQPGHRRRIGKAVSFISRQTASKCSHTRAFRFKWHFLFALRALVKSTSAIKCKFHFMNGIVNSQFMVATLWLFCWCF
jgi:hypothetical protein